MSANKFQVGDIVEFGGIEGVVVNIQSDVFYTKNLTVKFSNNSVYYFSPDGKLFPEHTKPLLNLVSRPKKKVKKTITRWVNVYRDGKICELGSKEVEEISMTKSRIACVELTGEYEVEE